MAEKLVSGDRCTARAACRNIGLNRSTYAYRAKEADAWEAKLKGALHHKSSKAVLSLSEVEVSPDGFDNRMLDGVELFNVGSGATTEPEPGIIEIVAITKAPFAFSFGAKEGRVYDVQSSQDLRNWGTLKSYNGTGTLIRFEDERDQVFPQIYYRVKVVE